MEIHDIRWDKGKVANFWNAYTSNKALEGTYFSSKAADQITGDIRRHIRGGSRILEIGCGSAIVLRKLAAAGFQCSGIDISPETIKKAASEAKAAGITLDLKAAPVESLPFPDSSFDAAIAFEVMEHLLDGELQKGISEVCRVLKRGGRLIISTPYNEDLAKSMVVCPDCGTRFHPMQHVRSFNEQSMGGLLRANGFNVLSMKKIDFLPVNLPLSGVMRRLKKTLKTVLGRGSFTLLTVAEKPK